MTPTQGAGGSGAFAVQAYDAAGYSAIAEVDLLLIGTDDSECRAVMNVARGQSSLYLLNDSGTLTGPLNLPTSATLQNTRCVLNGAGSSVSGSGDYLTANFNLSFTAAFAGSKFITGTAVDSNGNSGTNILGTWLVTTQLGPPILSSPGNAGVNASLSATLTWLPSAGATSYDVYFGTSATPPYVATTATTSYAPATLNPGSTYYWQIVSKVNASSSTSTIWSFTTAQSCSAPLTAASPYSIAASGSGATLMVTAASGCSWGYTSPVSWVTFQPSGGVSSGNGSLAFTVAANDSPSPRTTTITVAGDLITINQAGNLTCDVSGDNLPAVVDIQTVVNEALGVVSPVHDLKDDNAVNVADAQIVINALLGLGCVASGN